MEANTFADSLGAVVLADGLTSTSRPSGKDVVDLKMPFGVHRLWIDYLPYERNGTVETTDVFPFSFGLTPDYNPGRAGLERILAGDVHEACRHYVSLRADDVAAAFELGLDLNVHTRLSHFSSDNRTLLVCAEQSRDFYKYLRACQNRSDFRLSHAVTPAKNWHSLARQTDESRFELIGWCHGALLSALHLTGMTVHGGQLMKRPLPPPASLRMRRTEMLLPQAQNIWARGKVPVIYVKDPAWAARKGESKIDASTFVASLVLRLSNACGRRAVLLISDHNSEPGVDATLAGVTSCAIVSSSADLVASMRAEFAGPNVWVQRDLVMRMALASS